MIWSVSFFLNSILFGVGLAMDAFSVSLANGLQEPRMKPGRMCLIAGTFGFFQILMPLVGWLCVHTVAERFEAFQRFIPWIALVLLLYIGGKMLLEGLHERKASSSSTLEEADAVPVPSPDSADSKTSVPHTSLGLGGLLLQGIATSIDALSVGFTIADYTWPSALAESLIIGIVTFGICMAGLRIGKRVGDRLSGRASILGGVILIAIGLEIFLQGVL